VGLRAEPVELPDRARVAVEEGEEEEYSMPENATAQDYVMHPYR
jgi:hypothetical protein